MHINSHIILILFCLPAVAEVIGISYQSAIWFGEVIVWAPIVVTTETTHLFVVGAGVTKQTRVQECFKMMIIVEF